MAPGPLKILRPWGAEAGLWRRAQSLLAEMQSLKIAGRSEGYRGSCRTRCVFTGRFSVCIQGISVIKSVLLGFTKVLRVGRMVPSSELRAPNDKAKMGSK